MSVFQQPTPEQLTAFIAGDPIAIDEVVTLVLPQIYRWAVKEYSGLPPQEVQSVLHQVFAEICLKHERYDPQKSRITTYIINLLKRRLFDLWKKEAQISALEDVEELDHEKLRQNMYNESDNMDTLTEKNIFFQQIIENLDEVEQEFFNLMREGEKRLEVFTNTLEKYQQVSDPPREVKNMKERLMRKLKALTQDMDLELGDLL